MNFTYNEVDGDKPISGWMAMKAADYVRTKYGLDVQVFIHDPALAASKPFDDPHTLNSCLEGHLCNRKK
ncbi:MULTISPECIES: hypothetical protein [unclassified Paenibacillus]|uniref:hypothetical protein n=1 Tax=unclassified Paenibacillus TaxID=185978 RepID=UPI001AE813B2|nr:MULTISPECIES: hypothetical protein [unclassified Paenibacillus]MBP1154505.1 hypothetical protein [Paenibacillus sp. PvP091]MBP1170111.1 hypothetical protein [Paenibacillus sp. PvR098]MBP2441139.1 hypothetical protein [Paenibacillus sp. PvP052]